MKTKKILKAIKRFLKFIAQTKNNFAKMKADIKKILALILFSICTISCGTTKVSVSRPINGTNTTITVTTNNPITTNVPIDADLKFE